MTERAVQWDDPSSLWSKRGEEIRRSRIDYGLVGDSFDEVLKNWTKRINSLPEITAFSTMSEIRDALADSLRNYE